MLLDTAAIQVETAKRSRDKARTDAINRLLVTVLHLTARKHLNDDIRKRFAESMLACAWSEDSVVNYDELPLNIVRIDGEFDVAELAKKFTW